jgi:hypothetical protein
VEPNPDINAINVTRYDGPYTVTDWKRYPEKSFSPAGTGFFSNDFVNGLVECRVGEPEQTTFTFREDIVYNLLGQYVSYKDTVTAVSTKQLKTVITMSEIAYDENGQMVGYKEVKSDTSAMLDTDSIVLNDDGSSVLSVYGGDDEDIAAVVSYEESVQPVTSDSRYIHFEFDADAMTDVEAFSIDVLITLGSGQQLATLGLTSSRVKVVFSRLVGDDEIKLDPANNTIYLPFELRQKSANEWKFDVNIDEQLKTIKGGKELLNLDGYMYKLSNPSFTISGTKRVFL